VGFVQNSGIVATSPISPEADVAGTDEIRFWIMTWGSKAEVLEPASLREEIRNEAEIMANRYEGKTVAEESQPYGRTKDRPLQRG